MPDDLLEGGSGGGNGGGDCDVGDDYLGALRVGVGAVARSEHYVGVAAGSGVGEGELVVACGVGGCGSNGNQLYYVIGVIEGNGRLRRGCRRR